LNGRALAFTWAVGATGDLSPRGASGRESLVECRFCGRRQRVDAPLPGETLVCSRCGGSLRAGNDNFASLACTIAAAVLFVFALGSSLMEIRAAGRVTTASLFTGPTLLARLGMGAVGILVLLTLVVAPLIKFVILLSGLLSARVQRPSTKIAWLFGWLDLVSPWAMVEVFLLGVFVAYTRLRALAQVEIGPSLVALAGVMVATAAADSSLDREAVWEALDTGRRLQVPRGADIACRACDLVSSAPEGERCPRCRHRLFRRKPDSLARAWALTLASAILYIPANALPIMTVERMGRGGPHTILSGVEELARDNLWPLAIIVVVASVVVPLAKLGAMTVMLVATHRRSSTWLLGRTRVFRIISLIGRWSMIDIFALSTLVALVRMGVLATVMPNDGAIAFSAVVVLTMLGTESFDPRLMWDAALPRERQVQLISTSEPVRA
jgi:paraquat-inducible protein A